MTGSARAAALAAGAGGTAVVAALPEPSLPTHMAAHALLVSVAAPLVAYGLILPRAVRARFARRPPPPVVLWLVFVGAQWAFHVGPLFRRAVDDPVLHQVEHAVFIVTAVGFWLPLVGSAPFRRALGGPGRTLYAFLALPATDLVGLWFMASGRSAAGTAMVAAMLPLAAAAFGVTWSWLAREEESAVRWERFGGSPG